MSSECAICLQKCVHPVKLDCCHIFCFLCIKGAASLNRKCPMCRQAIADTYFDCPQLLEEITEDEVKQYEEGFQWFYEGRNGWWLYDKRTIDEIEEAFQQKQPKCEMLIAGFVYVIDFEKMLQYRRNEPQRQRKVKRDHYDTESTKGIAGLRRQVMNQAIQLPELPSASTSACASGTSEASLPSPQNTRTRRRNSAVVANITPQTQSAPDRTTDESTPSRTPRYRRFSSTRENVTQVRSRSNRILSDEEQDLIESLEHSSLRAEGYRETYL